MTVAQAMARWAACAVAIATLMAVFASYLRPDLAMTLANQLWSCF